MNVATTPEKERRIALLRAALDQGTMRTVQRMVNALHPADIAGLLESLPPAKRELVWDLVDRDLGGEVLVELNEEVRADLISDMETEELINAVEALKTEAFQ